PEEPRNGDAETMTQLSGGKPSGSRVMAVLRNLSMVSWNTHGLLGKNVLVEEALEATGAEVILLQETLVRSEVTITGLDVLSYPAEEGPGKQGMAIAAKRHLR
ncbi:MAG: uncharacterized protein A8A55_3292, partial [Amphiamblys sp. WSBS2006]